MEEDLQQRYPRGGLEGEKSRRKRGGVILEGKPWKRNQGAKVMSRHHGGVHTKRSVRRDQGGCAIRTHAGDTQKQPYSRRHPRDEALRASLETHKETPGSTPKHPGGTQGAIGILEARCAAPDHIVLSARMKTECFMECYAQPKPQQVASLHTKIRRA